MTVAQAYQAFKPSVLNKKLGDGECVSLVVNNAQAYVEHLWPGLNWETIFPPVVSARQLFVDANPKYFEKVANNHNDPNQVPPQGAIMVFDATPQSGYSNTFDNPDGHTGICENASASGYTLLQQNAPAIGSPVNIYFYPWHFRPCIGWLIPILADPSVNAPPTQTTTPVAPSTPRAPQRTIFLPETTGPWHLYNPDGPYVPAQAKGYLWPSKFGGLTYVIQEDKGNGVYVIDTHDFGLGAIWTKGSDVVIR